MSWNRTFLLLAVISIGAGVWLLRNGLSEMRSAQTAAGNPAIVAPAAGDAAPTGAGQPTVTPGGLDPATWLRFESSGALVVGGSVLCLAGSVLLFAGSVMGVVEGLAAELTRRR